MKTYQPKTTSDIQCRQCGMWFNSGYYFVGEGGYIMCEACFNKMNNEVPEK